MNNPIPKNIYTQYEQRECSGARRVLIANRSGIDLSSNDYLGIARRLASQEVCASVVASIKATQLGATGSRLVSGNRSEHEELEAFLAAFHCAEAALLFGSGYEANIGLLSAIAARTDTLIYDELVHASMRDGIRLSPARSFSFRHNDLDDLAKKIDAARGECFIVVESVYSMDGDTAPLSELCKLAEQRGAFLIVDEAHATGVYGDGGAGLVAQLQLAGRVFARVHTFGKALGYRGACVVGSSILREHLINTARSFIYTTALDLVTIGFIRQAYSFLAGADQERNRLRILIEALAGLKKEYPELRFLNSQSPIQGVIVSGNHLALRAEQLLRDAGFEARAIRAPTVSLGLERIRLCLHSFNSEEELKRAVRVLATMLEKGDVRAERLVNG
ncbi:MAG: aminotransferase class I/II-fold pyridoxal phosphate-dependent enzyme [Pseudomonadota bacterium]|jgi:8-amino-7-oxononanoate synthase